MTTDARHDNAEARHPMSEQHRQPMTIADLRLYGVAWCDERTFALMLDVVEACERRTYIAERCNLGYAEFAELDAEDEALDALRAHLSGGG